MRDIGIYRVIRLYLVGDQPKPLSRLYYQLTPYDPSLDKFITKLSPIPVQASAGPALGTAQPQLVLVFACFEATLISIELL